MASARAVRGRIKVEERRAMVKRTLLIEESLREIVWIRLRLLGSGVK
jgi:hypothetical protein